MCDIMFWCVCVMLDVVVCRELLNGPYQLMRDLATAYGQGNPEKRRISLISLINLHVIPTHIPTPITLITLVTLVTLVNRLL